MATMKAKIPFTYAGVALKKGVEFEVKSANDVKILAALGNAELAPEKKVKEVKPEKEAEPAEKRSHHKKEVEEPKRTYKRRDLESE